MEITAMSDVVTPEFEIVAQGFDFIETPRVSEQGDLWFSDLTGKGVYRQSPGQDPKVVLPGRQWVGGMLFDRSGQVLCSGRGGIVTIDPQTGGTCDFLTEIEGTPLVAVNDMEADGQGGFYAGTIDFIAIFETGGRPAPGLFFHMSALGEITILRRDVAASNGIAASPCGKWLYHVETGRGLWRYPVDGIAVPGEGRLLVELPDGDGLAVDAAGNLWLACWNTARLLMLSPEGTCIKAMAFPYPHIVSVVFGADDPTSLYVATGGNAAAPRSGAVLRMKVDVPGLPGPLTQLQSLSGAPA